MRFIDGGSGGSDDGTSFFDKTEGGPPLSVSLFGGEISCVSVSALRRRLLFRSAGTGV